MSAPPAYAWCPTCTRYASEKSCANSLHGHFVRLGLPMRDRIEASVAASTLHGLSRRASRDNAHRGRLRVARGEVAVRPCAGVKQTYPSKGRPCRRPALSGSDYCLAHDPGRRADLVANLAAARERRAA